MLLVASQLLFLKTASETEVMPSLSLVMLASLCLIIYILQPLGARRVAFVWVFVHFRSKLMPSVNNCSYKQFSVRSYYFMKKETQILIGLVEMICSCSGNCLFFVSSLSFFSNGFILTVVRTLMDTKWMGHCIWNALDHLSCTKTSTCSMSLTRQMQCNIMCLCFAARRCV